MKRGITRREREVTDVGEIKRILDNSMIVHIGMVDGDEPYVVPMNYGYTLENGELCLYLHGATVGRKIDLIRASGKVFFEMECDVAPFEGDYACQYGTSYASLMGMGKAEILDDGEAKKDGLSKFMKTQTGKEFSFDDRMVSAVNVIKITSTDFTAKKRPLPIQNQKKQ